MTIASDSLRLGPIIGYNITALGYQSLQISFSWSKGRFNIKMTCYVKATIVIAISVAKSKEKILHNMVDIACTMLHAFGSVAPAMISIVSRSMRVNTSGMNAVSFLFYFLFKYQEENKSKFEPLKSLRDILDALTCKLLICTYIRRSL